MTSYQRLIIDGNNFLFRAFHTDYYNGTLEGKNSSVMCRFIKMLENVLAQFHAKDVYFTWDKKLNPDGHNFRNTLADYKGNRTDSDKIAQVLNLHAPLQEMLDAMGIPTVYPKNLEADDVICYLAKNTNGRNIIVSSDKDLLQLISDHTDILLPTRNLLVNLENFSMNANVKKDAFLLYKCILGDTSDNIKGLYRFGEVKAKQLAEKLVEKGIYTKEDDTENVLNEEQWEIITNNMKMVDLEYAVRTYPDEITHYEEQMLVKKPFDKILLSELFDKNKMDNCRHKVNYFTRVFDLPNLNMDDLLDTISFS